MRLFNRKSEFKNNFIDIDYTSPEFYAGMYYIKKDEKNFIENFINYFLFEKERQRKNQKLNKYFIKLIMKKHTLSDEDFISIVKNFRIIVENFCDLFEIGSENISLINIEFLIKSLSHSKVLNKFNILSCVEIDSFSTYFCNVFLSCIKSCKLCKATFF